MAREYAMTGTDIWNEQSIRALTVDASWLYQFLRTQGTLTRAGVVMHQPGRWQAFAADLTRDRVDQAVKELTASRHLLVDYDTEETLIRTYVRKDHLLSQPMVVAAMVTDYRAIVSQHLRDAVLIELRRAWDDPRTDDAERNGLRLVLGVPAGHLYGAKPDSAARIAKAIGQGLTAETADAIGRGIHQPYPDTTPGKGQPKGSRKGQAKGQGEGSAEGQANPSRNPSAKGQPDPSADPLAHAAPPRATASVSASSSASPSSSTRPVQLVPDTPPTDGPPRENPTRSAQNDDDHPQHASFAMPPTGGNGAPIWTPTYDEVAPERTW